MKRIYKIGNYVFFIFMGILLLGGICLNTSQIERVPLINLLIGTSVVTILLFLIYLIYQKLTSKKIITKKKEIIIVVVISIILISLLSVTAYLLRNYGTSDFDFNNNYEWDFKVAVGYINSVVDKKDLSSANFLEYLNYRTIYSNLDGIIMVVMPIYYIFRAFGVTSLILPGIVVNIIFIYLSLLFSYFIARKLFSVRQAIFYFGISILFTPIFLYSSIFYSDTLSMPFVLGIFALYFYKRDDLIKKKSNFWLVYILIGVLTAIGCYIKATVLFVTFSSLLDLFIQKKRKAIFDISKVCVCSLCCTVILYLIAHSSFMPHLDKDNHLGFSHYIMLGLVEDTKTYTEGEQDIMVYGVFNHKEVDYSFFGGENILINNTGKYYSNLVQSPFSKEYRKSLQIKRIKSIIKSRNAWQWLKFFNFKYLQTWADGSCYAPIKLSRGYLEENFLGDLVRVNGKNFHYYYYLAHYIHMSLIFYIFMGCLLSIKSKTDEKLSIIKISITLLILFLLIWETRSRYILNYLLIFYLLAIPGLNLVYQKICHNKKS